MKNLRTVLIMIAILLISTTSIAQDPDGWDEAPESDVPVDGFLSVLLAGGIAYGAKKWHQLMQKKTD
jgi:hypothetical protein